MVQKQNTIVSKELGPTNCSILLDEVKEKMNTLKKCGMTEKEIISRLFCCHPLPQLTITRNYKFFLGDERKEVHMESLQPSMNQQRATSNG